MKNLFVILTLCLFCSSAKAQSDLKTFLLQGPVKTVVENEVVDDEEVVRTYSFDRNGRLVSFRETEAGDVRGKIKRKNGRIVQIGDTEYAFDRRDLFEYSASGILESHTVKNTHLTEKESFEGFNKNGWPMSATIELCEWYLNYQGDGSGSVTFSYSGLDRFGNWTILQKKGSITKTGIEIDEENEDTTTEVIDKVITREITYYK